jgi:hypothetical protein
MMYRTICRVCGVRFRAPRFDAVTCSSTCRQRLRRGHDLAYLAGLTVREQRAERRRQEIVDEWRKAEKKWNAGRRVAREGNRNKRQARAKIEHERIVAEIVGRAQLKVMREEQEQAARKSAAAVLKLFAEQRRNDMSAQAMADFLNMPGSYPVNPTSRTTAEQEASRK